MFATSAGTTPVAMPGQGSAVSVGLMLDKSQGFAQGPQLVTNGTFDTGISGWAIGAGYTAATIAWDGAGGAILTCNSASPAYGAMRIPSFLPLVAGKKYLVTATVRSMTCQYVAVGMSSSTAVENSDFGNSGNQSTPQTLSFISSPTLSQGVIYVTVYGTTGQTAVFDDISVREISANYAIAINDSTARPELRARVNLLVATATLSTQSVTTQATSYTLRFAGTGSITLSGTATGTYSAGTHTITCTAGTLTLTVSGTVTTADLRPANSGALLPAYQAVTDANTYDTAGFPLYLRFDGIDDGLYTPANLNLTATDKVGVFAGVRKLATTLGFFAELSASTSANNGSFYVIANNGTNDYGVSLRGTAQATYQPATYTAPISNVLAVSYDIAGAAISDEIVPRVNGVVEQDNPTGANAGTGNFGTYPLYIGSRNNSSLWLNGQIYGLVVVGSAVSAGNISATESWMAQKTGIVIP